MPRAGSPLILLLTLLVVCATVCARVNAADAPVVLSQPPTPLAWDQWQPQRDSLDRRLDAMVTVRERRLTFAEALRQLGSQTSVVLSTTAALADCEISVFIGPRSLRTAMVAVTRLFPGYWAYRRGQAPVARTYCFTLYSPLPSLGDWEEELNASYTRDVSAAVRPPRERQLGQYREALAMSAEEVLSKYEQTDPWLCSHVLSPAHRPIIEQIVNLRPEDLETFLATSGLSRPLRDFPLEFQQHVALWAKGTWGRTGGSEGLRDPDSLLRFSTPEENWANSVVNLHWGEDGLSLMLILPNGGSFFSTVVGGEGVGSYHPRVKLAEFGYREGTPEYLDAAREEMESGVRPPPPGCPSSIPLETLQLPPRTPDPDQSDPRLRQTLRVDPAGPRRVPASSLLERAAQECELAVLSVYLPDDHYAIPLPEGAQELTLGWALSAIRRASGTFWTWEFAGDSLIGAESGYWVASRPAMSEEVFAEWAKRLSPGASIDLDVMASGLAEANELQVGRFYHLGHSLPGFRPEAMRLYGLFTPEQRGCLRSGESVRLADLPSEERRALWRAAKETHPWLALDDLKEAVLRGQLRTLSTGEPAMSLVLEYHFAASPNDRDILFTSPLTIHIPAQRVVK